MKTVRPIHLLDDDTVHYLWPLQHHAEAPVDILADAARRLAALGWGIDLVVGGADRVPAADLRSLASQQWNPAPGSACCALRVPIEGSLRDILNRHEAFIGRLLGHGFSPASPLTRFEVVGYRRSTDPEMHPIAVFELRRDDGTLSAYPHRKLIHIAGMVRHLAIKMMKQSRLPEGGDDDWVETYVAGHARPGNAEHRQFSYLPLPSIGHPHTNPAVRRVMVVAPVGDERLRDHLAVRLAGQRLVPTPETKLDDPPTLVWNGGKQDGVVQCYTDPSDVWCSVTPVILPGHDDRKPVKTRRLIEKALRQSGIDHKCEFEWSAFSQFPKSLSAHKYDRNGRPTGYVRPDHLLTQTAVHLKIRFNEGLEIPGPIAIGAVRHCGFGLMAHPYQ